VNLTAGYTQVARMAIVFATVLVWPLAPGSSFSTEISHPRAVVELFTSQGCSSCPPADRVLSDLVEREDTLALAWHVDYWDYLGWKDTFARPANTERQKAYARSLGKRSVYTPQAVVNGRADVVGSRENSLLETIDAFAGTENGLSVPIEASVNSETIKIRVDNSPQAKGAKLWMVYFDKQRDVDVKRGENGGHRLRYSNIVRNMEMIGMVKDQVLQTEFALDDITRRGHDACALILQKTTDSGDPGPIIGAAFLRDL
jgi:hypothetical protein